MASKIMDHFSYEHLPEKLQEVSKPIGDLARQFDATLPDKKIYIAEREYTAEFFGLRDFTLNEEEAA